MATKIPGVKMDTQGVGKKWPEIGLQKFPWCWNIGTVWGPDEGIDTQNQGL